jgi:replicative DNA helicase
MAPSLLLERIVARAARVRLTALADRTWNADQLDRVQLAMGSLEGVASRLGFLGPPFSLQHLAAAADDFGAGVLVVDYIQRFVSDGPDKGKREALEDAASILRRLCDLGACVLCAAAVSRQKGRTGSNYASLGLASFRGSSELEYGADSAYLAIPDDLGGVRFENPKQRYGKPTDIQTVFDSDLMTFSAAPSGLAGFDAVPLSKDNH